jgi:hypothetical protein
MLKMPHSTAFQSFKGSSTRWSKQGQHQTGTADARCFATVLATQPWCQEQALGTQRWSVHRCAPGQAGTIWEKQAAKAWAQVHALYNMLIHVCTQRPATASSLQSSRSRKSTCRKATWRIHNHKSYPCAQTQRNAAPWRVYCAASSAGT